MRQSGTKSGVIGTIALTAWLIAGCGDMKEPGTDEETPIWTVKGLVTTLSDEAESMDLSNLRAAFIWFGIPCEDGSCERVVFSQEVPLSGEFPNQFEINIDGLIPKDKMFHQSADVWVESSSLPSWMSVTDPSMDYRFAVGNLVIYNDKNGNEKLDFIDNEMDSLIDYIVGSAANYAIFYFESDLTPIFPNRPDVKNGINIFYRPSGDMDTRALVSLEEPLLIEIEDRLENQFPMCRNLDGVSIPDYWFAYNFQDFCKYEHDFGELDDFAPDNAAVDRDLFCMDDGRTVYYQEHEFYSKVIEHPCLEDESLQDENGLRFSPARPHVFTVPADQPLPEGWPCLEGVHESQPASYQTCPYEEDTDSSIDTSSSDT